MTNKYLELCKRTYYDGYPIVSDSQYDELERMFGEQAVGTKPSKTAVPHMEQMYSLQKYFVGEDEFPFTGVETPKLDGAAISILYDEHGYLVLALTRGDGIKGEDITDKVRAWDQVPNTIVSDGDARQITGEVVLPRNIFNARNKASGALGLNSVEEFISRKCSFVAYGSTPSRTGKWSTEMKLLRISGFNTVLDNDWEEFPQDGKVVRIDNIEAFDLKGHTSKHPRGAYAIKTRAEGTPTELLDVIWQVGKSGKVTPVGILAPIVIDDATITRATLNNQGYIQELGLEIGDTVLVERAGGIIPKIISKVS